MNGCPDCPTLLHEIDTLRAALTSAKRDTERLDWLEKNVADFNCTSSAVDFALIVAKVRNDEHGPHFSHDTLRAAIDAAKEGAGSGLL